MIDKCLPGSYSETGVEPCGRCPINFYQKDEGKTNCTECPLKQRTQRPGAKAVEACVDLDANLIDCKNGGLKMVGNHEFVCICPSGFSGRHCEININECASNPCYNDAICVDKPQGYKCECRKGYFGLNCELEQSECVPESCPEGAMCHDLPGRGGQNSVKCLCREGFRGDNCDITMNPCTDFSENLNWNEFTRGRPMNAAVLSGALNGGPICQNDGRCIPLEQG